MSNNHLKPSKAPEPALKQADVKRLRAFLAQEMMDANVAFANAPNGSWKQYAEGRKIDLLQKIQKFISDM
jgi:hypothetical protein